MKTLLFIVAIILGSTVAAASSCHGTPDDLILTGKNTFVNVYHESRQKCFTVNVDFVNEYRKGRAIAAPGSLEGFSNDEGVDYSVQVGFKGSKLSVTLLIDSDTKWKRIEVNYLVTARDDFWVGSFSPSTADLLGCWNNEKKSTVLTGQVDGFKRQYSTKAVVFISALRSENKRFYLDLKGVEVNPTTGELQVQIFVNAEIEVIQISYAVYSTSIPLHVSTHSEDFGFVRESTYGFIGANQIVHNGINFLGLAINSKDLVCQGSGCHDKACVNVDLCKKLGGTAFERICILCSYGEIIINNECRRPCKSNEVYVNGKCQCDTNSVQIYGVCRTKCAAYAYYDDSNQCVCFPGYYIKDGKCERVPSCGENEALNKNYQCVCEDGFIRDGKGVCRKQCETYGYLWDRICECLPGYYRPTSFAKCQPLPRCGQNEILNKDYVCVCADGFIRDGKDICRKQCESYGYLWDGVCECLPGYYRPSLYSKCQKIPSCGHYEVLRNYECVCTDNYVRVGRDCVRCSGEHEIIQDGQCVCKPWYIRVNGVCVYEVRCGENEEIVNNKCVCKPGFKQDYYGKCVPVCSYDQVWHPTHGCICAKDQQALFDGKCQECPQYSQPNYDKTNCKCLHGYVYEPKWNKCFPDPQCPQYSTPVATTSGFKCVCFDGYIHLPQNNKCHRCEENSSPNSDQTSCICDKGYEYEAVWKKCVKSLSPSCPERSSWNPSTLKCECKIYGQYLIKNECRSCGALEGWNGAECVCKTGYFKINGVCRTCDPNTKYDGKDCVCNLGFYGNRDRCDKCHHTCGTCSGPNPHQCLTCTDVSYSFDHGTCSRDIPCPAGLYLDLTKKSCTPCSSYCATCRSESICDTCIDGFKKETINDYGFSASFCVEKCGDGKRFELDCDDGNWKNGDGCNKDCEVEKGWTCSGGSSIRASTCAEFIPDRSYINPTKAVHLFGKVVQGVRLSFIPKDLTKHECSQCNKLLWVKVIKSSIIPGVRVSYLPKSTYQFFIEFDFHGTFSIPVFTFSIQLNPDYQKHFSTEDMAQIQVIQVDPAVLKTFQATDALTAQDIENDDITSSLPAEAEEYLQGDN